MLKKSSELLATPGLGLGLHRLGQNCHPLNCIRLAPKGSDTKSLCFSVTGSIGVDCGNLGSQLHHPHPALTL